jgi:glycine/D-amino acid oxidase-like deaminating enzyme
MEVLRQILRIISHLSSRLLPSRLAWIALQDFVSPRPPMRPPSEGTVILGAGVIGLSTAYYLAMELVKSGASESAPLWPPVVVVDPSSDICSGASGEATGGLGDFGFSSETSPLGLLSYRLHKELASEFGGREKWGFSDLEIYRVTPKNFTGSPSPLDSWGPALPVGRKLSDLPNWIKASEDWAVQSLAEAPHSAHL